MRNLWARLQSWSGRNRALLPVLFAETAPLELQILGRMLLHAALVGVGAGFIGAVFFGSLEYVERLLLEELAGYSPLRAYGESFAAKQQSTHEFRPWLLAILPALGGLGCGLLTQLAPETRGGGLDAMLDSFHNRGGAIRRRVLWVKVLASLMTLGTGGAGGREGPTIQIGGALGSVVGRVLHVSARERRILLVAGAAAGISAVFRTPLGAALLAVEILYRDGYESDALIPSVLASVVAYSVVISIYGETTLFAHATRFPFIPAHLPLYAGLALVVALFAAVFARVLHATQRMFERLAIPDWSRPALGGLALGVLAVSVLIVFSDARTTPNQGLGVLGGGYGAVQAAITGAPWLDEGVPAIQLLLLLTVFKIIASSLTIGSGGSAGDFAPSLAIGGLCGGAYGRAVQLLLEDPRIDPGAFALVGMGAFYGGIAHVPLSALVLVCELAGNYDLLVPLMLAQGIAFVALRKRALYPAQVPTLRDSPVHRDALLIDVLKAVRIRDVMLQRPYVSFRPTTSAIRMLREASEASWQEVFPVVDEDGRMLGLVDPAVLRILASEGPDSNWALAADVMLSPVAVAPDEDLRIGVERLLANGLREIPVVDREQKILGFLDEDEVAKVYIGAASRADNAAASSVETGRYRAVRRQGEYRP